MGCIHNSVRDRERGTAAAPTHEKLEAWAEAEYIQSAFKMSLWCELLISDLMTCVKTSRHLPLAFIEACHQASILFVILLPLSAVKWAYKTMCGAIKLPNEYIQTVYAVMSHDVGLRDAQIHDMLLPPSYVAIRAHACARYLSLVVPG